jgi:hypothetical protein
MGARHSRFHRRGSVVPDRGASSDGRDLALFGRYRTDKKIGIGVVDHCHTVVEPPKHVARLIRKALEHIPPERLVITTDGGFGREGLSRHIAYYKMSPPQRACLGKAHLRRYGIGDVEAIWESIGRCRDAAHYERLARSQIDWLTAETTPDG